jgi:hypothetical protein
MTAYEKPADGIEGMLAEECQLPRQRQCGI